MDEQYKKLRAKQESGERLSVGEIRFLMYYALCLLADFERMTLESLAS